MMEIYLISCQFYRFAYYMLIYAELFKEVMANNWFRFQNQLRLIKLSEFITYNVDITSTLGSHASEGVLVMRPV